MQIVIAHLERDSTALIGVHVSCKFNVDSMYIRNVHLAMFRTLSIRMITKHEIQFSPSYILFVALPVSFASLIMVHTFVRKRVKGFRGKRAQLNSLLKNLKESQAEARALTSSRGLWCPPYARS